MACALLLACLLSACAFSAAERQTLAEIGSREPILFERCARWGYSPDGHRGIAQGIIVWEGRGMLVLTPTTLYLLHGNRMSRTISYAAVVAAEVGPVQDWAHPPFGAPTTLVAGSRTLECYGREEISERHRHRYEFNNEYRQTFAENGMNVVGTSPDGGLVEIVEIPDHLWFVAVQFHPEFKSQPTRAHPLFAGFIGAAIKHHQQCGPQAKKAESV